MRFRLAVPFLLVSALSASAQDEFARSIRPVLAEHCASCHNPANPKSRINFLQSNTAADLEKQRGLWRNVAAQMRNRTMPPMASKLAEADRLRVASWIDDRLRTTACSGGDFAGSVITRRLNRREYHNTIRDIFGVDFPVNELFPADGTGGEGFDTHGETLYLPPLLMERYLEAAQQILDRAIVTPPLYKSFSAPLLQPAPPAPGALRALVPGQEVWLEVSAYAPGDYEVKVPLDRPTKQAVHIEVKVDGTPAGTMEVARYESKGGASRSLRVRLTRGVHKIALGATDFPIDIYGVVVEHKQADAPAEKKALHFRLFGMEPGQAPLQPREAARRLLSKVVREAYRRPLQTGELDRYLLLYDRGAERGDPYEERIKLALKALLVSPKFLFRIEEPPARPGIQPLGSHELAARLSYFLWSTTPDAELSRLADEGRLQDPKVLTAQVERMLDDPRSRTLASTFMGQWLGTKDVGGRVVPAVADVQQFYNPEVAADLREEPAVLFDHLLGENRSLLDLVDGNYTFLTDRLITFYELDGKVTLPPGPGFHKVEWPDRRRGGILGLGSVLAMTSHYKQTSPVLRGAWVLETLLGTTVPPPPPDVPPLDAVDGKKSTLTVRQKLEKHRADPSCAACHNLMDPIGFGLENFDWMGRWRDTENGTPVDAEGVTPAGEKFSGPVELRQVLLRHREEFLNQVTGKLLGYALGRALQDQDQCTIQQLTAAAAKDNYGARTLLRQIVLSIPFRNSQAGVVLSEAPPAPHRARPRQAGEN